MKDRADFIKHLKDQIEDCKKTMDYYEQRINSLREAIAESMQRKGHYEEMIKLAQEHDAREKRSVCIDAGTATNWR